MKSLIIFYLLLFTCTITKSFAELTYTKIGEIFVLNKVPDAIFDNDPNYYKEFAQHFINEWKTADINEPAIITVQVGNENPPVAFDSTNEGRRLISYPHHSHMICVYYYVLNLN